MLEDKHRSPSDEDIKKARTLIQASQTIMVLDLFMLPSLRSYQIAESRPFCGTCEPLKCGRQALFYL